jgi:uncharacterized protein with PIN domain
VRFLCDHMLGTLAKWLRFLGNDVGYAGPLGDNELKSLVEKEGSVLLTRDRELAGRVAGSLCVTSDDLNLQLLQVLHAFHLPAELSMTRCSVCNAGLVAVPKEQVRGKVPEGVFDRQPEFWRCGACGRHYWQGSHWASMNARMREIRGKVAESPS